jgi:hypothetical protein
MLYLPWYIADIASIYGEKKDAPRFPVRDTPVYSHQMIGKHLNHQIRSFPLAFPYIQSTQIPRFSLVFRLSRVFPKIGEKEKEPIGNPFLKRKSSDIRIGPTGNLQPALATVRCGCCHFPAVVAWPHYGPSSPGSADAYYQPELGAWHGCVPSNFLLISSQDMTCTRIHVWVVVFFSSYS